MSLYMGYTRREVSRRVARRLDQAGIHMALKKGQYTIASNSEKNRDPPLQSVLERSPIYMFCWRNLARCDGSVWLEWPENTRVAFYYCRGVAVSPVCSLRLKVCPYMLGLSVEMGICCTRSATLVLPIRHVCKAAERTRVVCPDALMLGVTG